MRCLWLVKVKSTVPYDSYDSFVVRADDEDGALRVANEHGWGDAGTMGRNDVEITQLWAAGPIAVLHKSFKAG